MSTDRALEAARWIVKTTGANPDSKVATVARALLALSEEVGRLKATLNDLVPFLDDLDDATTGVGVYPDVTCTERCRKAVAAARAVLPTPPSSQPGNSEVTR